MFKLSSICQLLVWLCCITIETHAQSQTGLVQHYSFDGSLSNTAGTNTITGGSNFVADRFGLTPSAYFVQTNADIISNAGIPNLPIGGSARTVAFWFQTPSGSGNYHLFNYGAVGHGLYIFYGNGIMSVGDGVTSVFVASLGSTTSWRHVAVTYEGAKFILYINGVKTKEEFLTINTPASPVSRIGKDAGTTQTSNFKIDDLYIYNRALSAEEVTKLHTVKCLPDPVATLATDTICAGQTVRISFERNLSVYANSQATGTALAFNDGYTTPALTSTTTYYIQSGAGSCVSNIIPVTVPVKAKAPVPVIATQFYENNICGSGKGTLTVEANASYNAKWYTASTGGTAVFTGVSYITPTIGTNTTYYVAHEGAGFCASNRVRIDVTILTRPVATLTASHTSICPGDTVTFSGFENADFSLYKNNIWAAGGDSYNGPHSYKDAPTQTSTYAVRVGDWAWCQGTATVTVTVKPAPAVVMTASKSTMCSGESVGLTSSGADIYVWSTGGRTASTTQSPVTTTTYSVKGTSAANGCSKTVSTTVTVTPLPTVVISPATSTICAGQAASLSASGATTYSWSTAATTPSITASPTAAATYTVTGTSNGCSKTATATVTVKALPKPTIQQNGNVLSTGTYESYQWYRSGTVLPDETSQNYRATASASFSVFVTDVNGCSAMSQPLSLIVTSLNDELKTKTTGVYPNPTSSVLNINATREMEASIFSTLGEKLKEIHIMPGETSLNVSFLPVGVYLLHMSEGEYIRFIKE